MAEGGALTSIRDGSDADFEYTCSPCGEDHIREEAVKYCPVCEEHLCATCTRHHGRQKATRSHALLDRCASTRGTMVTMTTKCRYHTDRDIEMYCGAHDMVYCLKCIANNHRSCSGVTDLEEVNISSSQGKDLQRLNSDVVSIQKRLQDTERNLQTNICSIEDQRNDIMAQIEGRKRDLVEHIQKLESKALETLETEYTSVKDELHTNISTIRTVKQEIEKTDSRLRTTSNLNVREQFVQAKLINQVVKDALKMVEQGEARGCASLCFVENTELKASIITSASLGRVEKVTENKSLMTKTSTKRIEKVTEKKATAYKVISKNEIDVGIKNDHQISSINDMCQLPDGTIILADINNSRIKRFDVNHNIKDCFDLETYPTGICCTGITEIAVKLTNYKVQFISVGSSLSKLRDISVSRERWGMTYCDGKLWLATSTGVHIYNKSGTLLNSISEDVNGRQIFKSTPRQMTVSGDNVIVTDDSDGAVCLRKDGTVIRELRDKRLVNTRGVCVSNDGIVFISGYTSNNIMMFDKDGKCLRELVDKKYGLQYPKAMCYDTKKDCILVACFNSNKLKVLHISY